MGTRVMRALVKATEMVQTWRAPLTGELPLGPIWPLCRQRSRPFSLSTRTNLRSLGSSSALRIGIVGAKMAFGQVHKGVQNSPDLLRRTGLVAALKDLGYDVKDFGDITQEEVKEHKAFLEGDMRPLRNPLEVALFNEKLSKVVKEIKDDRRVCCILGGDHSIGLGSVHGHMRSYEEGQEPCILWVDAHTDINTTESTMSGSMHGVPMSFHLKEVFSENRSMEHMDWFYPTLNAKNIAYIGLRCVDPEEKQILEDFHITAFSMRDIDDMGIKEVTRRALKAVNPQNNRPLHVSFDIDALDPSEAPCTGTPVPGGLTLREGLTLMEECFHTGCLEGLDLVEINTDLFHGETDRDKTLEAGKRIILAAFGKTRVGKCFSLRKAP